PAQPVLSDGTAPTTAAPTTAAPANGAPAKGAPANGTVPPVSPGPDEGRKSR
ncbi:MAG: hypothetical protein JWQ60_5340, partial [Pseudonocardia sp.]|nr:hypothetical protein [Pseudonocardia sp.]